ncbi:MAG: RagB/SusD family nutrient uptake outer membrane protein [Prevotellaceae bacterium]|jgi:hypothetical protein|nr:RagB/SusD family nutrient uptake outer membrane protein [Prevotellaceae bacterium]
MKLIRNLSLAVACIAAAACSLDYEPAGGYSDVTEGVTRDSVKVLFKDKAAVTAHRQTLLDRYKNGQEHWYLDMLLLAESHSDNAYAGSPNAETTPFEVNSIEGSNTNLKRDWDGHMTNVGYANRMICGIDQVADPTLTAGERRQYKAEALILRAMVYFDMARIWGRVPLITLVADDITAETIEDVYPVYFPSQSEETEVYRLIEADLLEALDGAPDNNPNDKTGLSKSVARAMLAKLYAEKPLRDYDKVILYADALTADGFALVDDFADLFGVALTDPALPPSQNNRAIDARTRNTRESVYEAQFFAGNTNWVTWMYGRPLNDWTFYFTWAKWITPSRNLVAAFNAEQGDKRLAESVAFYACDWNIYYPASEYAFMYKCRSAYSSIIKLRYADILMLKAEALIHKGSFAAAAAIINQTRRRAGLNDLPASASASKEAILDAYLKERRLELAFEGERWFDLVRLDKVEEVMNAVYAKDPGRPAQKYPFNTYSCKLPIPQDIIDQNPNLVQNPGY